MTLARVEQEMAARGILGPSPAAPGALAAYAVGTLPRQDALQALGLRDHAALLVALGDVGLTPPRPPAHLVEAEAVTFEAVWRGAGP